MNCSRAAVRARATKLPLSTDRIKVDYAARHSLVCVVLLPYLLPPHPHRRFPSLSSARHRPRRRHRPHAHTPSLPATPSPTPHPVLRRATLDTSVCVHENTNVAQHNNATQRNATITEQRSSCCYCIAGSARTDRRGARRKPGELATGKDSHCVAHFTHKSENDVGIRCVNTDMAYMAYTACVAMKHCKATRALQT